MGSSRWRTATWPLALAVSLIGACGDDDGHKQPFRPDGGVDAGPPPVPDGGPPEKPEMDAGPSTKDGGLPDASGLPDVVLPPLPDSGDDTMVEVPPPPADWSCPKEFWADGICDCGCTAKDWGTDCQQISCAEPGCIMDTCDACYNLDGAWKSCDPPPNPLDWLCDPDELGFTQTGLCDCGCGIPDPDCLGNGCSEPSCRRPDCDVLWDGVSPTASKLPPPAPNPPSLWQNSGCPWDAWGGGNGCDCGCDAHDPDCGTGGGCNTPLCNKITCDICHDKDGRPVPCNDGYTEADGVTPVWENECNPLRYGAGDGCDCGCGAPDPDCNGMGCVDPGCQVAACDRCTEENMGQAVRQIGCAPEQWTCNDAYYGVGDGCDCGCGVPDPDCGGKGCTGANCQDADCDYCTNGSGIFIECPGWTCTNSLSLATSECDCGCGIPDPACRDANRIGTCTGAACEETTCQFCNDGANRTACGGSWEKQTGVGNGQGSACDLIHYGIDGLCDCGCGELDPDCEAGEGCTAKGCVAPGCDVCHNNLQSLVCFEWLCAPEKYGSGDGCDCGCGAPDLDCGAGGGCTQPGCVDAMCDTCFDPFQRAVPCP